MQSQIILEIKKHIYDRQLKPGDILPSQATMALAIGASRSSIREAVKTMEAQGLLRTINGKGIYVENVDLSFNHDGMNANYVLDLLIDALGVRRALEGMAVEETTQKATYDQLCMLSAILLKVEARYEKGEYQADLDLLFHQTLISLSGNALLIHMLKSLLQTSSGIWNMRDSVADILSATIPDHRAMMDCMLKRDVRGAAEVHNRYLSHEIAMIQQLRAKGAAG